MTIFDVLIPKREVNQLEGVSVIPAKACPPCAKAQHHLISMADRRNLTRPVVTGFLVILWEMNCGNM